MRRYRTPTSAGAHAAAHGRTTGGRILSLGARAGAERRAAAGRAKRGPLPQLAEGDPGRGASRDADLPRACRAAALPGGGGHGTGGLRRVRRPLASHGRSGAAVHA